MDGCKLANKASLTTSAESLLRSVERNRQYQGAGARQMVKLCGRNRAPNKKPMNAAAKTTKKDLSNV